MTDIQAWIDDSRAHADRAAAHVANIAAGVERWTMKVPPTDTDTDTLLIGLLDGTLGQALTALQAVLDIHRPSQYGGCAHTACDSGSAWPCPPFETIQDALGGINE